MKWILPLAMLVASLTPVIAAGPGSVLVSRSAKNNTAIKTRSPDAAANGVVLPPFYRDAEGGSGSVIPGGGCKGCGFAGDCACEFEPKVRDNIWGGYCAEKRAHQQRFLNRGRCTPVCDPGIPLSTLFCFRNQCVNACDASDCGTSDCSIEPTCAVGPVRAAAPAGCGMFGGGFFNGCGHSFCLHRIRGCNLFGGGCGSCGGGLAGLFQRGSDCSSDECNGASGGEGCAACGGSTGGEIAEPVQAAPGIPVEPEAPVEMTPTPAEEPATTHPTAAPTLRSVRLPKTGRYPLKGAQGQ
jgi:hypothetical protein